MEPIYIQHQGLLNDLKQVHYTTEKVGQRILESDLDPEQKLTLLTELLKATLEVIKVY